MTVPAQLDYHERAKAARARMAGAVLRRVAVPGCPIMLRPADAAVYYATMGYPPRSIVRLMRGQISAASVRMALSQARARGERIPASFAGVPNVVGRLAKMSRWPAQEAE